MAAPISNTEALTKNFTPKHGSISFFCNAHETEPFRDQVVNAEYDIAGLSSAFQADIKDTAEGGKTTNAMSALQSLLVTLIKREDFKNKLAHLEDTARKQFDVLQGIWQSIGIQSGSLIPKFLNNVLASFYVPGSPPSVTTILEKILGDRQQQADSLGAVLNTKRGDTLRAGLEYLHA